MHMRYQVTRAEREYTSILAPAVTNIPPRVITRIRPRTQDLEEATNTIATVAISTAAPAVTHTQILVQVLVLHTNIPAMATMGMPRQEATDMAAQAVTLTRNRTRGLLTRKES